MENITVTITKTKIELVTRAQKRACEKTRAQKRAHTNKHTHIHILTYK